MRGKVVIGTAGTGKTSLLIESVSRVLKEEFYGETGARVLVIAPSSTAVNDIRSKLEVLHPECCSFVTVNTVRSLCACLLRDTMPKLLILSDFGSRFLLRKLITSGTVPIKSSYNRIKEKLSFIREIFELIESADIRSIITDKIPITTNKLEDIRNIYGHYVRFCRENNMVPAFEVIPRALPLLYEHGKQFGYIFIDQYEHLRPEEVQAVNALSEGIYQGRNSQDDSARLTIFLDPVLCAPNLISRLRMDKDLQKVEMDKAPKRLPAGMPDHINRLLGETALATRSRGDIPDPQPCLTIAVERTHIDEAEYIAKAIKKEVMLGERRYSDFAILCRELKGHGNTLCDALRRHSIPFSGGLDIAQSPEVWFVLLSLQVAMDPQEDDITLKWLSSPAGMMDRADVYRAYAHAKREKQSLWKIVTSGTTVFHRSENRLKELLAILDFIRDEIQSGKNIWELIVPILAKSGSLTTETSCVINSFVSMVKDIETTYDKRQELSITLNDIKRGLAEFSETEMPNCKDRDAVKIMSIQQSMGLEFPIIFIPGMVNGLFPIRYPWGHLLRDEDMGAIKNISGDSELPGVMNYERWLLLEKQKLYIGMTRARERLYLTYAKRYPKIEDCEPSIFLIDILEGGEISADNCARFHIAYHDYVISGSPGGLFSTTLESSDAHTSSSGAVVGGVLLQEEIISKKQAIIPDLFSRMFSGASIRSFLSCPRQYFLRYLINLETEGHPGARFGNLIHTILKEFHSRYRNLRNYSLEELKSNMQRILSDAWDGKIKDEHGVWHNYAEDFNKLQGQSYFRLAGETLQKYLTAEYDRWDEERCCVLVEKRFRFSLSDKYVLVGRIDRIDSYSAGGNEIIDFKTSTSDKEAEPTLKSKFINVDNKPDYRPQDYQIPIYCLACLNDPGINPKKLVIYQLRHLSGRTGGPFRREFEIFPDETTKSGKDDKFLTMADLKSIKDDLLKTLDMMVSGFYPPNPRDDETCKRCGFSFVCDREEETFFLQS